MKKELLKIICCPITKEPLQIIDKDLLERLNELIVKGALKNEEGEVQKNEIQEAEGSGANVLDDPREALSWLVNDVGSRGVSIGAGELVTTGTCVVPVPVSPGDEILADFGVLGQVETRFN